MSEQTNPPDVSPDDIQSLLASFEQLEGGTSERDALRPLAILEEVVAA